MKRVRVGTCQRCKTERRMVFYRGTKGPRIVEHDEPHPRRGTGRTPRCTGSGLRSIEDGAPDREKARAARASSIDRIRDDATVALDAYQLDHESLDMERIAHYRKLALTAYRLVHERSQPNSQCVKWHGRVDSRGRRDLRDPRVDIFCVFCGHRVATFPKAYYANTDANWPPIERHTTICALAVVAGLLVPVKPHTMIRESGQVTLAEVVPVGDGPLFGARG